MGGLARLLVLWLVLLAGAGAARAEDAALAVTQGGVTRRFTQSELLARPDAASIAIGNDISYGRAMSYRAVPLLGLLAAMPGDDRADTLESRAEDGFAAQIPLSLVRAGASGGAVAWVAVEAPGQKWPDLPGKGQGAGPFYLVWEHPERSGVASEQWPFQLASLEAVESPAHRWPQLAADPSLPADAPARRGEAVFITNCLPCHRLNGGGAGEMGPDLGRPMNVMEYMTEKGLRAIVRDPRAVRSWPMLQMPGFAAAGLPDGDLDALVAYLRQSGRAGAAQ